MDKFGEKNAKWLILTKNWHTWYIKDADSYSDNIFFELLTLNPFLAKFGLKKSMLSSLAENWHTECLEDVDFCSDISFFSFQP